MFIGHERRVLERYKELVDILEPYGYTIETPTKMKNFVRDFNREGAEFVPPFGGYNELEQQLVYQIYEISDTELPELAEMGALYRDEFVELIWTIDFIEGPIPPPPTHGTRNNPFHSGEGFG